MIQPMLDMSPDSQVQQVFCMWPTQVGKSVLTQLVVGYYAKEVPSEIIYATSNQDQAKKAITRRIEPILKVIGVQFRTQTENRGSRRTGDVTFSKEFDGGNLDIGTAGSAAFLASETKRIGIGDELDRWEKNLGTEGSPWSQLYTRLKVWRSEKKALGVSSPKNEDDSKIFELFLTGDQNEWFMPCPLCGEHQILTVSENIEYGLKWDTKLDNVIKKSVVYVCKYCAKSFKEIHKHEMLQGAEWRAQGVANSDLIRSYHMTSLNSKYQDWLEVASLFEAARDNIDKNKEFQNQEMGLPFRHVGSRPKAEKVIENQGTYRAGTVPDGVIYITSGIDVQRGANRWANMSDEKLEQEIEKAIADKSVHKQKFPRLEVEYLGIGPGYRTFSIDYQIFYGRVENAFSGAWEKLNDHAVQLQEENGVYGFLRRDGHKFPVVKTLVDSGYKPETGEEGDPHTVYVFCGRWGATAPCKGFKLLKKNKLEQKKQATKDDFTRYRKTKVDGGTVTLYEFSANHYKQRIYNSLKIQRIDHEIQPPGFQDFPKDYPPRYFDGLTAEEKLIDGNYDNAGRYNEPLDNRNMAAVAADAYLDEFTEKQKAIKRESGQFSQREINERINHKYSILLLSKRAGIDPRFNEVQRRVERAS
jgi:phage terminase large subunit GpA-like protein